MRTRNLARLRFSAVFACAVFFASCPNVFFYPSYTFVLPAAPERWVSLLGEPHWRVQWADGEGGVEFRDALPREEITARLPQTWAHAVTAWPYWPGRNIGPGMFRPCGALFPYDASGGRLYLSWEAGADAVFYWALASAYRENPSDSRVPRLPQYFDWMRLRELFETDGIRWEIREDRWLADWGSIAERTVNSGFDSRRLVPEASVQKPLPVPGGVWHGSSPFAKPLVFEDGQMPAFPARAEAQTWVSEEGILRVSRSAWSFTPWGF